jgi:hypothetical protein
MKLHDAYGKALSKWLDARDRYEDHSTGENKQLEEDAYTELASAKNKYYSFAEQEWQ